MLQDHVYTLLYHVVCPFTTLLWLVLIVPAHRDGQAELAWVAGDILRWFACSKTVTHSNLDSIV